MIFKSSSITRPFKKGAGGWDDIQGPFLLFRSSAILLMPSSLKPPYIHGPFSRFKALLHRESAFFCAVIFGAALRMYQLPNQILFGDEWHAVHTAANAGYFKIISTFGGADHSIPITLYYKVLMDTIGLSEMGIRIPFLVGGTLTVLILPILVRPMVGRTGANIFAWLLALSPTLIFFSRFARPYALTTCFSFFSCIFFFRWWENNKKRDAILYAISAIATGYALLVDLPFVLGPFLFFFILSIVGKDKNRAHYFLRLAGLGTITMVPLLILLAPPIYGDFSAISTKAGQATFGFPELAAAFRILTGMDQRSIVILIGLLALMGLNRMFVGTPIFTIYLMGMSLLQMSALFLVQPVGVGSPHILARYLLPTLPCLLLLVSTGTHAVSLSLFPERRKWARAAIPIAVCSAFFWGGPILAVSYQPNNGTSLMLLVHALSGKDYRGILKRIPGFYRHLSNEPRGSMVIVETPFSWQANHLLLYQEVHRQRVIMGVTEDHLSASDQGFRLKTVGSVEDLQALRAMDVDFLVFHKNLQDEVNIVLPDDPSKYQSAKRFQTLLGNPIYEDRDILVFAVSKSAAAKDWEKTTE